MTEKTAVPEYCRFCRAGYWPGCGDPDGCREAFKPITGRGRIGVHR